MTNQDILAMLIDRFFTNQENNINKVSTSTGGIYLLIISKARFANTIPHITFSDKDIMRFIETTEQEIETFRTEAKKAGYIDFSLEDGKYKYIIIID
jgi:hypothetical protein